MTKTICLLLTFFCFQVLEATSIKPYVNYTAGQGVDFNRGYTTAGCFVKLNGQNKYSVFLPYLDLRGHLVNNGRKGVNVGLGARSLDLFSDKIIGGNLYYDYTHVRGQPFHQLGVGLEFLGPCWDLRTNAYFPLTQSHRKTTLYSYVRGEWYKDIRIRKALTGFDVELGWTIKEYNSFAPWGLYLAGGPYYYCATSGDKCWTVGVDLRVNMQLFACLSVEGGLSVDRLFDNRYYGKILFSVPLRCFWSCEENWRKITELPRRNDFIVIKKRYGSKKNY